MTPLSIAPTKCLVGAIGGYSGYTVVVHNRERMYTHGAH